MNNKDFVRFVTIAALSAGFVAAPASAAGSPADAKEKKAKTGDAEAAKVQKHFEDDAFTQFDLNGDGTVSDSEKAAAGERYQRVTEAMARRVDGSKEHAERMAKRDSMKASKEAVKGAGLGSKGEAIEAMGVDNKATKEAVKSGEMTREEAKAAKKDQKKWWQFWKSGN